ncbi:hypothetical protein EYW45_09625 [Achromobacter sp. KS-M25]|nr:hypothetical protein [Achromobacter aestuarii]
MAKLRSSGAAGHSPPHIFIIAAGALREPTNARKHPCEKLRGSPDGHAATSCAITFALSPHDPSDTSSFYHTFTGMAVYSEQERFQKFRETTFALPHRAPPIVGPHHTSRAVPYLRARQVCTYSVTPVRTSRIGAAKPAPRNCVTSACVKL